MLLLFSNRPTIYIFSSTRHKNLFKGLLIFIEPLLYNKLFFKFTRSIESRKKKISLPPSSPGWHQRYVHPSFRKRRIGDKGRGAQLAKIGTPTAGSSFSKRGKHGLLHGRMGEPGRETLEERGGEGEREKSGGYLSFSGAARKPSEILRLARFEDLSPPPSLPVREGHLSTWHYAAVNVQITPHLLHSKQRSFNDTRTGGGTVVNFSRDQTLSLSLSLFYRDRKKEKRSVFSSPVEAIARLNNFLLQQNRKDSILVDLFLRI